MASIKSYRQTLNKERAGYITEPCKPSVNAKVFVSFCSVSDVLWTTDNNRIGFDLKSSFIWSPTSLKITKG